MPHDINKLTVNEQVFCVNLVKTGDKYKSFTKAGYKAKNKASAASAVSRLLKSERVLAEIDRLKEEVLLAGGVTVERIAGNLAGIAFNKDNPNADRSRALELLGRHLKMYTDNVHSTGDGLKINISERNTSKDKDLPKLKAV